MTKANYRMITLARESRGLLRKDLAEKLKISASNISRIESGDISIDSDTITKISDVLNYPPSFFFQDEQQFNPDLGFYRKRKSILATELRQSESNIDIDRIIIDKLIDGAELTNKVLPEWDCEIMGSPRNAARYLRNLWKVPKGRIDNVSKLIEDNGVIIVYKDLPDKIDGYSLFTRRNSQPVIFVNKNYPTDRIRLSVVHELGHLIMHCNKIIATDRDVEAEAFEFAGEFLVPERDFINHIEGDKITIQSLVSLKRYWRVSMHMLVTHAHRLDIISYNQARYLYSQMSRYRQKEPYQLPPDIETPYLFKMLLNTYINEWSIEDLSRFLHLNKEDFKERYLNYSNTAQELKISFRKSDRAAG